MNRVIFTIVVSVCMVALICLVTIKIISQKGNRRDEEVVSPIQEAIPKPEAIAQLPPNADSGALPAGAVARLGNAVFASAKAYALSPDCKRLAVVTPSALSIYELPSMKFIRNLSLDDKKIYFSGLRFISDRVLVGSKHFGSYLGQVWNVDTGTVERYGQLGAVDSNGIELKADAVWMSNPSGIFVVGRNPLFVKDRQVTNFTYEIWQSTPLQRLHVIQPIHFEYAWEHLSADSSVLVFGAAYIYQDPSFARYRQLQVFDTKTGKEISKIDTGDLLSYSENYCVSPDGEYVAAAGMQEGVKLLNTRSGQLVANIETNKQYASLLEFDRQGRLVVANKSCVRVFESKTGKLQKQYDYGLEQVQDHSVRKEWGIEFPPTGSPLTYPKTIDGQMRELDTGKYLYPSIAKQLGVESLAFSEDGKSLVIVNPQAKYQWWDVEKRQPRTMELQSFEDRVNFMWHPVFTQDGSKVFNVILKQEFGKSDISVDYHARDTLTGKEVILVKDRRDWTKGSFAPDAAFPVVSQSGSLFGVQSHLTNLFFIQADSARMLDFLVYDAKTKQEIGSFPVNKARNVCATFSQDDQQLLLATETVSNPKSPVELSLYDLKTKAKLLGTNLSTYGCGQPLMTPDSRRAIFVHDRLYLVANERVPVVRRNTRLVSWNLVTGEIHEMPSGDYGSRWANVVMSHCGRWFVVVTTGDYNLRRGEIAKEGTDRKMGQTVRVFETSTATQRYEWNWEHVEIDPAANISIRLLDSKVVSLALSPDSQTLAAGMAIGTVLLCDMSLKAGPQPWVNHPSPEAALWEKFTHQDAQQAWPAMRELVGRPDIALSLFRKHVQRQMPGEKPNPELFAVMIAALGHPDSKEREQATASLEKLGRSVELELLQARKGAKSPEVIGLLNQLLSKLKDRPEDFWESRAVEVLEAIDTKPSRELLQEWSGGDSSTALTRESIAALKRLSKD